MRSPRSRRRQSSVGLVVMVCGLAACADPPSPAGEHLADAVPIVDQGVSTDIILPPLRDSLDLLGRGWEDVPASQATVAGLWVLGQAGSFRFYSATDGPLTLEAEATTLTATDATQHLEVFLNDASVDRQPMAGPWTRYEFSLPASDLQLGWNEVTLGFNHAFRPADIEPGSKDSRQLAARFRRLRVRSAEGRPIWPDRPVGVDVVRGGGDTTPTITMPTDSVVTFHLVPIADTIVRGEISTSPVSQSATSVSGAMEAVDAAGQIHRLVEQHPGDSGLQPFEVDLGAWADEPIQLRLRSWGRDNGFVRWGNLTVSAPADPTLAEFTHAARLAVPPVSGRLGIPDVMLIQPACRLPPANKKKDPGYTGICRDIVGYAGI